MHRLPEAAESAGAAVAAPEAPARKRFGRADAAPTFTVIDRAAARYWTVVVAHFVVDLYPMFFVALVATLQVRLALTEAQAALVISVNGIISGLSQPIFAWIGDKLNTRLFGALGLAIAAMAVSSIGFAQTYMQLLALQIIGMAGVGIFHPVSSALAGRLGRDTFHNVNSKRSARGVGLAIFFAAGVGAGGFFGPLIATRVSAQHVFDADGMKLLAFMAIPGLFAAGAMWMATRRVPHRTSASGSRADEILSAVATEGQRWFAVAVLFVGNTLRFTVNLGLLYLFKRWAELRVNPATNPEAMGDAVSNLHANVIAVGQVGMGLSALALGRWVGHGHERRAMILTGLLAAPIIMIMPGLGVPGMLVASGLVAFGYFGVIPTSLSLAQRLLPHATGMTGGILMGSGWAISALGPIMAERITKEAGLQAAFFTFGGMLAMAGVVSLLISPRLIRAAARLG